MSRVFLFVVICALILGAQDSKVNRASVFLQAGGGKRLTIEYERPSRNGRTIMGGLVPYGKIWPVGEKTPGASIWN